MASDISPKARPPRNEKVVTPLTMNRVKTAEYMRNVFAAIVPAGVTVEDLLRVGYWTNCAKSFRITDRIEVTTEDGIYFVELMVVSIVMNQVRVKALRIVDLEESAEEAIPAESKFEVKHRGQILKHTVQFKETKEVIKEGFDTRADAEAWLLNYETGLVK